MNFQELFKKIKPRISWFDDRGFHYCEGCGREMDRSEKQNHWPINCSLSKSRALQKIRASIIETNLELYQKYGKSKGVIINLKVKVKDKQVPLSWYKKQLDNYTKLPINFEGE